MQKCDYLMDFNLFVISRTNTLKLEGVKRVWGKEGYLPQKEPTETTNESEDPNSLIPSSQETVATQPSPPEPESPSSHLDQEKKQLASSLFVGLGSQNPAVLVRSSY